MTPPNFEHRSQRLGLSRRGALGAAAGVMVGAAVGPNAAAHPARAKTRTLPTPPVEPGKVGVVGDLHRIAENDLVGSASLEGLLAAPDVYGIGMLAGLDTEVLIRRSRARVGAFDRDHDYCVHERDEGDIAFLVYAQVPRWQDIELAAPTGDLEHQLPLIAGAAGLDPDQPFPFVLRGHAVTLRWYVVGGMGNGVPSHQDSFLRARTLGGLDDAEIRGVGFFARGQRGTFTPPNSDMHVHFAARRVGRKPVTFVAHLEEVLLAPGAVVRLPVDWAPGVRQSR